MCANVPYVKAVHTAGESDFVDYIVRSALRCCDYDLVERVMLIECVQSVAPIRL